jgi:hypothetical protein
MARALALDSAMRVVEEARVLAVFFFVRAVPGCWVRGTLEERGMIRLSQYVLLGPFEGPSISKF